MADVIRFEAPGLVRLKPASLSAVSTLGRATDPTAEELARVEETLVAQGIGGWLAVQSHSFHRGPPPPTFVAVRRLGEPGSSFEKAVANAAAKNGG